MSERLQWHLSKAATLIALVGVLVFAALGWVAYYEAGRMVGHLGRHAQSDAVGEQIAQLQSIEDAEIACLQGYLLTGDQGFLTQRRNIASRFAATLKAFRETVGDDPVRLQDAQHLEALFAQRLARSAKWVALFDAQGQAAAIAQFAQVAGGGARGEVRSLLAAMAQHEDTLDAQRLVAIAHANQTVFWLIPAGSVLGILLLAVAIARLNQMAGMRLKLSEAVHASAHRYRQLLEGLPVAAYATDATGNIAMANKAAIALWGRTPQVGDRWCGAYQLLDAQKSPLPPEQSPMALASARQQACDAVPGSGLRPDGSYFAYTAHVTPMFDRGVFSGTVSVMVDVTESSKARERMHLLETCIDHLNDIVLITEAEPQDLPGPRIVYVNNAFERRTGFSRFEVIGQSPRILQGAKTQRDALDRIRAAMRQWHPVRAELVNYTKAGEEFWLELDIVPVADASGWFTHFVAVERDISAKKASDSRLQLTASVFAQSREGILVTDAHGVIVEVNAAFERITGYAAAEVLGHNPRLLQSGRHGADFYAAMWQAVHDHGRWFGEIWNRRKDGQIYPELLSILAIKDAHGATQNYAAVFSDMSDVRAYQQLLENIATSDSLTGLPNRAHLAQRAEAALIAAQRGGEPVAALVLGIDHFKGIVATRGHDHGNQLLVALGARIQSQVRAQDALAHVPGEGFALLMPQTDSKGAGNLADKLLCTVAEPFAVAGQDVRITVSIGIASYPGDAADFESLMARASSACQRGKSLGGDGFYLFNEAMHQAAVENQSLASDLRLAVGLGQLSLHYQPFVDLQSGQMCGMEALLRWTHPTLGAVSPGRFIPIAEESGAIKPIGAWVFRRACQDIRAWLDQGLSVAPVAINVSPIQFRDAGLVQQIEGMLAEFDIAPDLITVEVTEGALVQDVGASQAILESLKSLGLKLSLDDFGTGYSSLSYLKLFPFDKVKIDQSFVRNIPANHEDGVIASVVVAMAHGLGLRVIAEGVETDAQCAFLRDHMCDEIQGYLFAKAMPAHDMAAALGQTRQLPGHLLRNSMRTRTLLLVDDEPNVISALKRLLRRDGYTILAANSGQEGLDILAQHPVDIIVADQRMPGMTGLEFLRAAKQLYPHSLRIVLSGYTELQSVTDAINEGAIYRFLTKPWLDEQLRTFIQEAFDFKELADENLRLNLEVRTANSELAKSNRLLQESNAVKASLIARGELSLNVVRETLHYIPLPVLGVDDDGMVAFANMAAVSVLGTDAPVLGNDLADVLPDVHALLQRMAPGHSGRIQVGQRAFRVEWHTMGEHSTSRGKIISLLEEGLAA